MATRSGRSPHTGTSGSAHSVATEACAISSVSANMSDGGRLRCTASAASQMTSTGTSRSMEVRGRESSADTRLAPLVVHRQAMTAHQRFERPTLHVGIAAYNAERNIGRLLTSLVAQRASSYTLRQIVVHSDASSDDTVGVAKRFGGP